MTRFTSTNPATGETVWEGEAASTAQVGAAVEAARAARGAQFGICDVQPVVEVTGG